MRAMALPSPVRFSILVGIAAAAAALSFTAYTLFAGDDREDNYAAAGASPIEVRCGDGSWQAYVPVEVTGSATSGAVEVKVKGASQIAITDAVVDNGFVDGSPPAVSAGIADVLFKDGGIETNDPIVTELTARRGETSVSNFVTPIRLAGNVLGVKLFRPAPLTAGKTVAVTVAGTCGN